jgi:hypothetical protein
MPRLIKGQKLTHEQREMVLAAFIHRDTVECPLIRGGVKAIYRPGPFARQTDENFENRIFTPPKFSAESTLIGTWSLLIAQ